MAESHVLTALRVRRADLANDIRGMNEALAHLDATIKLLEQGVEGSLISAIRAEEPETNSAIFAGTSAEKLQKINANEYLKSQYDAFKAIDCKNMVIYGASLAENDKHVWDAILENANMQNIYISYHGDNPASVKQRAEEIFNGKSLQFFQSKQFVEETSAVEEETK